MMLFLEGVDPTIPEYVENGSYVPFVIIVAVPATATTEVVPEREAQSSQLKKNLVKDSKDSKSTHVVLVFSEIISSQRSSTLTITELDSDLEDPLDANILEFDECLALQEICEGAISKEISLLPYLTILSQHLLTWKLLLAIIVKKYDILLVTAGQRKFSNLLHPVNPEMTKSSSDEEDAANLCLMAKIEEEVEEPTKTSTSTTTSQISISSDPVLTEADRRRTIDVLTID
ncbi:hypothetical protein L6452_15628 [Arctium lappa]|uniref:Uncharacterized protein n=1 Tax=Arctium lappa TaxID=4217 RepID=A0ACB9CPA9_ARCLA|nr:hypothetical protein L6452_15628 [Arctium lappa]